MSFTDYQNVTFSSTKFRSRLVGSASALAALVTCLAASPGPDEPNLGLFVQDETGGVFVYYVGGATELRSLE